MDQTAALTALLDRQAITDVLMRYSRAIDRKDFEALRTDVYWPDATDDHLLYEGGVDGLVTFCRDFTVGMPTFHFLGNVLIDLLGETEAFAETYHMAYHDMPGDAGRQDLMIMGRYLDNFEKRGDVWRIRHRSLVLDSYQRSTGTSIWTEGLFAQIAMRGHPKPDDPLYRNHPRKVAA